MGKPLNETEQRGMAVLGEMLGEGVTKVVEERIESNKVGVTLTRMALENTFAETWGRDQLDRRARSLVTLGVLIASRSHHELGKHFRIGLKHGLTPTELEEVVMQAHPYVGHTASVPAMQILVEELAKAKAEPA